MSPTPRTGGPRPGDREEIIDLIFTAAEVFDTKAWDRMAEVFTADAVAYGRCGLAEITANTVRYLDGCGPTQHLVGNCRIRVDGDTATAVSYVRAFHLAAGADPFGRAQPPDYWDFLGEYTDTLRRTSSGWRIAIRECRPIAGTGSLRLGEP
ncbi:MAG: nuclear transport factor 2 family protein [Jatrophihabitans sp.]|nr:MAG: nuclear transport factor 2 family protein [Jatrophihabitans sp.]